MPEAGEEKNGYIVSEVGFSSWELQVAGKLGGKQFILFGS